MGAKIQGAGTDKIVVQGVEKLHGTQYEVLPDRIEGGTYLLAGAITRGHVRIKNTRPDHLDAVIGKLIEAGAKVRHGRQLDRGRHARQAPARGRTCARRRIPRSRLTCRRNSPRSILWRMAWAR